MKCSKLSVIICFLLVGFFFSACGEKQQKKPHYLFKSLISETVPEMSERVQSYVRKNHLQEAIWIAHTENNKKAEIFLKKQLEFILRNTPYTTTPVSNGTKLTYSQEGEGIEAVFIETPKTSMATVLLQVSSAPDGFGYSNKLMYLIAYILDQLFEFNIIPMVITFSLPQSDSTVKNGLLQYQLSQETLNQLSSRKITPQNAKWILLKLLNPTSNVQNETYWLDGQQSIINLQDPDSASHLEKILLQSFKEHSNTLPLTFAQFTTKFMLHPMQIDRNALLLITRVLYGRVISLYQDIVKLFT